MIKFKAHGSGAQNDRPERDGDMHELEGGSHGKSLIMAHAVCHKQRHVPLPCGSQLSNHPDSYLTGSILRAMKIPTLYLSSI
ncbi:hypothetical protein NC652_038475 [Populus alba x Populus x berolinensis]|nr:hypothetical protein NC652_038475 [Populus alba x Populus x berolinensis]